MRYAYKEQRHRCFPPAPCGRRRISGADAVAVVVCRGPSLPAVVGEKVDVGKQPCLEVNHVAANTLGSFLHGLREGRVGVDVAADFLSGEVEALR